MAAPSINGTPLPNVSNIAREPTRSGKSLVAKSGKRHWIQQLSRLDYSVWEITMEVLTRAQADSVKALVYNPMSTTPLTFADGQGNAWSAQCEEDSYKESIGAIDSGVPKYTVTLRVYQAD